MTPIDRKIAALEAKAASTTFPAEAETCRRLAEKLRARLASSGREPDPLAAAIKQSDLEFAAAWAAQVLGAVSADGFGFGQDLWCVPDYGPFLSSRGLFRRAVDLGHRPNHQHLQASVISAMGWAAT